MWGRVPPQNRERGWVAEREFSTFSVFRFRQPPRQPRQYIMLCVEKLVAIQIKVYNSHPHQQAKPPLAPPQNEFKAEARLYSSGTPVDVPIDVGVQQLYVDGINVVANRTCDRHTGTVTCRYCYLPDRPRQPCTTGASSHFTCSAVLTDGCSTGPLLGTSNKQRYEVQLVLEYTLRYSV